MPVVDRRELADVYCPQNINWLASHVIPRPTTVAQPVEMIGRKTTELLLQQIHDPEVLPETVILDSELMIRESTAPSRLSILEDWVSITQFLTGRFCGNQAKTACRLP